MNNREKLSKELLREMLKDPGYRKANEQIQLARQIGAEVAQVRKRKRLSEEELAERIGKSKQVVRRMEKGEYKQYTIKLLLLIAQASNTDLQIKFIE